MKLTIHYLALVSAGKQLSSSAGVDGECHSPMRRPTRHSPGNAGDLAEKGHLDETKAMLESCSIDDATTKKTIKTVYDKYHYLLDPHSAVAFKAMEDYQQQHPSQKGIIVSTAHPVKFPEVVEQEIGRKIDIPDSVKGIMDKQSVKTTIEVDYESLTNFIKNIQASVKT
ncbi:MAG: hypothetical protein HYX40_04645 [Sphingobacteriales bacterium]|nr:hypothetical protein [Sphingobacteriales bacterium]